MMSESVPKTGTCLNETSVCCSERMRRKTRFHVGNVASRVHDWTNCHNRKTSSRWLTSLSLIRDIPSGSEAAWWTFHRLRIQSTESKNAAHLFPYDCRRWQDVLRLKTFWWEASYRHFILFFDACLSQPPSLAFGPTTFLIPGAMMFALTLAP